MKRKSREPASSPFTIYADTTGTPGTSRTSRTRGATNATYLAVGAIAIRTDDKASLEQEILRFKRELYPRRDPSGWKLHGTDFCAKKMPPHGKMNGEQVCQEAFEWLVKFIRNNGIKLILYQIQGNDLRGKNPTATTNFVWRSFLRRCDRLFTSVPGDRVGRIVHDRDSGWEPKITHAFESYMNSAISQGNLSEPILFDGPEEINMLDIADMFASLARQAAFGKSNFVDLYRQLDVIQHSE